jgi:galactokinase
MLTWEELSARAEMDDWCLSRFGADPTVITAKRALVARVLRTFAQRFAPTGRQKVWAHFVPGRVEILGKHTDYAGGHSLVAALDRGFFSVSRSNGEQVVHMIEDDPRFAPCRFPFPHTPAPKSGQWALYPMTMARRLAANFGRVHPLRGVDVAFGGDLPVASGLSGSSALMVMTFFALAAPNGLTQSPRFRRSLRTRLDLAAYLACAENGQPFGPLAGTSGVGTFGGSEDHVALLTARRGMLSLYGFCPLRHKADCTFPEDLRLVIAFSGVRAEKTTDALPLYNRAVQDADLVVASYNRRYRRSYRVLGDLLGEVGALGVPALLARVRRACRQGLPGRRCEELVARFRQFLAEDQQIIPGFLATLLRRHDPALGAWINRSHALSRRYLRNIVPEVDWLQRWSRRCGALGASGFGAGFGGSVYALVPADLAATFVAEWRSAFCRRFPEYEGTCEMFVTALSAAAGQIFDLHPDAEGEA